MIGATDVFVSYKAEDRSRLRPFVAALEAEGFTVWWDNEITPGETFRKAIRDELDKAGAVIVIWTPQSAQSNWVISEVNRAYLAKITEQQQEFMRRLAALNPSQT